MSNPENLDAPDEFLLGDLFRPLVWYRKMIWQGTILLTLLTAIGGGFYFFLQPVRWTAFLDFKPVFGGAEDGQYPNGLAFSPTDIVDRAVVDAVFNKNQLEAYCSADTFRSGMVVQELSPRLQFLMLEFESLLSQSGLSTIERQRIQDEFVNRRSALPLEYRLTFVRPPECSSLPPLLVSKAMTEILETWANEAQAKRGVLTFKVSMLSPGIFDQPAARQGALLVRADLLRTAISRVILNIMAVEELPGAPLARGSDRQISLGEIRAELEDLRQARLDPLVAQAGRELGPQSLRWIEQSLQSATVTLKSAQERAEAYRMALREYSGSGMPVREMTASATEGSGANPLPALVPQIDRSFVDRIMDLSIPNTTFRQEITRKGIDASLDAAARATVVEHYRQLLAALKTPGSDQMSATEVSKTLDDIATQAKEATRRFNEIYLQFTTTALRPGPLMYRVEGPFGSTSIRPFTIANYGFLVLSVLLATPVALAVAFLVQYHLRRFVKSVS